jgi:tRNA A-37 threonylcarbamoyl transferase component Bud32
LYILLDYYDETKTLDKYICEKNPIILSKWYRDLAMSVDYLHLHDITHGKIQDNIFINDNFRLILGEIELDKVKSKINDLNDLFIVMKNLGFTHTFTESRLLVKFLIKNF